MDLRNPITGAVLFSEWEMACHATGKVRLAPGFGAHLVELRMVYGRPMVVRWGPGGHGGSVCRSAAHNRAIGGHARSLHVYDDPYWPTDGAAAVDVQLMAPSLRALFVRSALGLGWSVGVATWGFHIDRRIDFTPSPQTVFGYGG